MYITFSALHNATFTFKIVEIFNCFYDSYSFRPNGTVVPLGRGIDTGVSNPGGYTLNYNEYIIYDTRQVKMRYLVKIQFDFK